MSIYPTKLINPRVKTQQIPGNSTGGYEDIGIPIPGCLKSIPTK